MHHIDIEKVRREMGKKGLDVLIAASLVNTYYCTGHYSKIWGLLRDQLRLAVILKDSDPFVTCPEVEAVSYTKSGIFKVYTVPCEVYFEYPYGVDLYLRAKEDIKGIPEEGLSVRDRLAKLPVLLAAKILKDRGLGGAKVGIDKEYIETAFFEEIVNALPHCEIEDATQIFLDLRAIKSEEEISNMVEAIRITEKAIETSLPLVKEEGHLIEVRRNLIKVMSEDENSEPRGLTATVSPLPVGELFKPTESRFKSGQIFRVDVGTKYNHYAADFARQWAIGDIPKEERQRYDVLLEAVDAMVEKLRPGIRFSDVYWTGNNIVSRMYPGYKRRLFMGHSIGLEVHERPYIEPLTEETLRKGMVICLEVPWYTAGGYAYNVEDEYLITEDGHRLLSEAIPRDLLEL